MQFLDKTGLKAFLTKLKKLFYVPDRVNNKKLRPSLEVLNQNMEFRQQYLLEIDYEKELAFDTSFIIGGSATSSITGIATAGAAIVGNA